MQALWQKAREAISSVLPITIIVLILNFTVAPIGRDLLYRFLVGAFLITAGLGIFLFGTDLAIQPIGMHMGSSITKRKSLMLLLAAGLVLGFLINMAEPDLLVLAGQVATVTAGAITLWDLVLVVSLGVGIMIAIGLGRIVFRIPLCRLVTVAYMIVFLLFAFSPAPFLGIAFDSGGATTGSMTVPFILSLGLGVASVQGGKESEEDSFGLLGIASIGPMLAVLSMGILSGVKTLTGNLPPPSTVNNGILYPFILEIPPVAWQVFLAIAPIAVLFFIAQRLLIKLPRKPLDRIMKGLVYSFVGLVLFLVGVNAGFMEAGNAIGHAVAMYGNNWVILFTGFVIGFMVIYAEPAVHVLNNQVQAVTSGRIQKRIILYALSLGVAMAVLLAMAKILIPALKLWHLLVPGYAVAIILSHFAPTVFVGIAFDSGGVASGPMTATFVLAYAQGIADGVPGADVLLDAFGVIGMVALTPLIAIQVLGLLYERKARADANEH
ncbi:MAG TPA: DUF1538 domain-containing protein [bacterium]|nr:DUF1538 domain-containing protein [bacterium]